MTETPEGWPAGGAVARPGTRDAERRRRLLRRAVPVGLVVVGAFAVGIALGVSGGDDGEDVVRDYAAAWSQGDWAAMHSLLTAQARKDTPLLEFARAGRSALETATATERDVRTGKAERDGDRWRLPVRVRTRIFGTVGGDVLIDVDTTLEAPRIQWEPRLVFPGLRDDERLRRETAMPARGALLARDRSRLAYGPQRASAQSDVAGPVVGMLGPVPEERAAELRALGVPQDAQVGVTGLERIFDTRLAGRPSGTLLAGDRVIARAVGRDGEEVRTTIDPELVRASTAALAGRYGAAIALDPRDGAVLGYAGVPFSIVQPPGSTFKIVTLAGSLERRITKLSESFEPSTYATLSGVKLANAYDEVCGGTLEQSFARSCNSVFAPLGARLGAGALVETAERFGFNARGAFPVVTESTIPEAGKIGDDLAVGSSAIGQGLVQATTLQMAEIASTVARDGLRPRTTLDLEQARSASSRQGKRAISAATARTLDRVMRAVVRDGTGAAAAIEGTPVAGKTGTAELRSRTKVDEGDGTAQITAPREESETDAWFVAYAPAGRDRTPRVAVAVLLVGSGAGGDTAAPAARGLLVTGLQRGR